MLQSWKKDLPKCLNSTYDRNIDELADIVVDPMLKFLRKTCKEMCETLNEGLVQSLLRLWSVLLKESESIGILENSEQDEAKQILGDTFLFAIIWSLCITCDQDSKLRVDAKLRALCSGKDATLPALKTFKSILP